MDEREIMFSRRVADAADAWLRDPQDTQVYTRLVNAVLARRAHLEPTLNGATEETRTHPDGMIDGLADQPAARLGEIIATLDLAAAAAGRPQRPDGPAIERS